MNKGVIRVIIPGLKFTEEAKKEVMEQINKRLELAFHEVLNSDITPEEMKRQYLTFKINFDVEREGY